MKNTFLSFLFLLFATALFAQQKDSIDIKHKDKLKIEFSFGALLVKENVNLYLIDIKKFEPDWTPYIRPYRDYSTLIGHDFFANVNLAYGRFFSAFGISYRYSLRQYYADGFEYNHIPHAATSNLKIEDADYRGNLIIGLGYRLFKIKRNELTIHVGFEKNLISSSYLKFINKDYYQLLKFTDDFRDFENIGLSIKRTYKHFSISVPLIIETSYSKPVPDWSPALYIYYKTGLIISF
ncbi:MAG: hypothetical protein RJA07_2690 [Bacteroidota bacterium]|jgi:hypothetical protein